MGNEFLEGIDPESVDGVEQELKDIVEREKVSGLLRKMGEEEAERSKNKEEFSEWKKGIEKAYAEAPGALREWTFTLVNKKVEELGSLYEELSSLDYREKHNYAVNIVLATLEHPEYPEGENLPEFLEEIKSYVEVVLEQWMLERSLQIRRMLKETEEEWDYDG